MPIRYRPMPTDTARAFQSGALDANGLAPEKTVSRGLGNLCRHCLCDVPDGEEMLVLAYRPFATRQPYAETGPVFLCARACTAYGRDHQTPDALAGSPDFIVRGYTADDRIAYGTGGVVPTAKITQRAEAILSDPSIAYVHVRSARNNCWQGRIDRA